MNFNSPYGIPDILVPETAVQYYQDDFRGICRSCFHGIHPHEGDCKVLLLEGGKPNGNQCNCRWRKEAKQ